MRKAEQQNHCATVNWFKRKWNNFWRRFEGNSDKVLEFLPTLKENEILDLITQSLGTLPPFHKKFQESEPAHLVVDDRTAGDGAATIGQVQGFRRPTIAPGCLQPMRSASLPAHVQFQTSRPLAVVTGNTPEPPPRSRSRSRLKSSICDEKTHGDTAIESCQLQEIELQPAILAASSAKATQNTSNQLSIPNPAETAYDTHDAGAVVEMSSYPSPSSESCTTLNADSSNQQHVAKLRTIESVFNGILRRDASKFRTIDAGSTELREVVIGGGSSDEAAGVGQAWLHIKQQNTHLDQVAQGNGTAAGKFTTLKHSPGAAAVPKAVVAALLTRRGRGRNIPSVGVNQGPIEGKFNDGLKLELNPGTSAATLPDATASLQPQLHPSALSTDSHRQVNSAAEELHVLQPPPRSRSRSRNTAAASMDPSASAAVVPPPPPRSRSSSRFSTSAGAESSTMHSGSSHQQKSTNLRAIESVFNAILRRDESQLKISRAQIPDAGATELRAIPFVSVDDPQGRGINNSSAPATQTPIEVTGYDGLEKDSSLGSGATSLLVASSSLQPRFIPSAQFTDSKCQDHAAATVPLGIPQPPPRSRSRSRNTAAASMDPSADADLAQC